MNQAIVDQLDALFAEEPFMKADGVDESEIQVAEEILRVTFSDDYRKFLKRYGGALIGPYPMYGLARAEPMDDRLWSVVAVTQHFRKQLWPGVDSWYVISMDHAGNPVGVNESGAVFTYDHDLGERVQVAERFSDYLEQRLSKL
jgi:cell wall assembly regulator SMI1